VFSPTKLTSSAAGNPDNSVLNNKGLFFIKLLSLMWNSYGCVEYLTIRTWNSIQTVTYSISSRSLKSFQIIFDANTECNDVVVNISASYYRSLGFRHSSLRPSAMIATFIMYFVNTSGQILE
jgi:hypothetical protein